MTNQAALGYITFATIVLIAQLNMGVLNLIVFNNVMTVMTNDFHRSFYEYFDIFSLGCQ